MSRSAISRDLGAALASAVEPPPEQLDLLPAGRRIADAEVAEVAARERRAGRPPGAQNVVTRELRRALHAAGVDGVWEMARWARLTPEELALRLSCTRLEAFDRLMALSKELGRYQHSYLAPTDGAGNVAPLMVMTIGGREATAQNARPPWEWDAAGIFLPDQQGEQKQVVGDDAPAPPNGELPNGVEKR